MADIFEEEIDSTKIEDTENDSPINSLLESPPPPCGRKESFVRYGRTGIEYGDAETERKSLMNNEIEIDFENFVLDELEELANSDFIHNRQLAAKKLLDSLQKAGTNLEEYQSIISVMCKLSEDEESMVRSELVQHIPSIALHCQNHPDLKLVISQQLVPYTVKLLNDNYISVRKLAQTALLVLLENNLIGQLQLSEWICPLVAQLAVCTNNHDELRIEDVTVMSMMMPFVETSLTTKFFLDPFISLCGDNVLGIRTVCAVRFGSLCKIVGADIAETSLLPAFLDLCNDVAWGVRKACANVFVDVANAVTLKTRKDVLSTMLLRLLDDSSNSVRLAAYQSLGAFICSFADPNRTGFVFENGRLNSVQVDGSDKMKNNVNTYYETKDTYNEHKDNEEDASHPTQHNSVIKDPYSEHIDNEDASHPTVQNERNSLDSLKLNSPSSVISDTSLSSEITVLSKEDSINENASAFNNFQYWREPLPDLDVNFSDQTRNSPAKTCVEDSQDIPSNFELFLDELQKVNYSDSKHNSLEDDAETLTSFEESILVFKSDEVNKGVSNNSPFRTNTGNANLTPKFFSNHVKYQSNLERRTRIFENSNASLFNNVNNAPNDFFLNQDIVPNEILMKYFEVFMSKSAMDDELNAACAFSFPAVTYTLGRKYWPCLRATFQRVTRNVQNFSERRNRCAIASSLPQLANMLGHEIIMEDLLPKFLDFLTDVDEVRQSVVLQIPDFLQHVPPEERCQFFVHIEDFLEDADSMKWRFRSCVAEQLSATLDLCNPYNIDKYFLPIALTLLQDKVFSVRLAAAEFMANIVKHLLDESKMPLLSKLDSSYRQAHKWNQRQTYVLVCEQLAKQRSLPVEIFVAEIVPRLFSLAWDVVPNVRLAVSRCIALTLLPLDYLPVIQKAHSDLFLQVYYSLQSDIDDDVRHYGVLCSRAYSAPSYETEMVSSPNTQETKY